MLQLLITTTASHADAISDHLIELGADAITWKDAGDQPIYEPLPGEVIQWDHVIVQALFAATQLPDSVLTYLDHEGPSGQWSHYVVQAVPDENWVQLTQAQTGPLHFGKRLVISPTWHTQTDPEVVNVHLNPGLAFGTGTHPTTALCLQWLDAHIQGGETVIDYGCGSGILAVSALKLGASKVVAVDYDPQALLATVSNAADNHIDSSQLQCVLPDDLHVAPVHIVLANILAQPLIALAPLFATLLQSQGKIVLSGILINQMEAVSAAYAPYFTMESPQVMGEWVLLAGVKQK